MSFSITILGSSSALPTSTRFPTAQLVNHDEQFFLIDCGEGTQIQLRRLKKKFGKINHIFISHLHGDHVFGLFGLLSSFSLLGRKNDLHLYGNSLLKDIIADYLKYFGAGFSFSIIHHSFGVKSIQEIYEDKKLTISVLPLKHRIPCVGFIFKEKAKERNMKKEMITKYQIPISKIVSIKQGEDLVTENKELIPNDFITTPPVAPRSFAFITDTRYTESIIKHIQDVNLLYHEATFASGNSTLAKETYHSTSVQAAAIAKAAHAKKLIIGHFSTRYKDLSILLDEARTIFPETFLAEEGLEFEV